jgi:demethylmenaquinone methyltransferase/2-methoxy-6-polyprenyl-1,4-benzoquinol methylase
MSTFLYMRLLESSPARYDRGIRMLSGGKIGGVYERLAEQVAARGKRVLDVGCGTGAVALACAARGADVVGIDINPGMLEIARTKRCPHAGRVEWLELGAMEIEDRFPEDAFDGVASCLTFSELSAEEQSYVLKVLYSRMRPGGTIVIADEVLPRTLARRLWYRLGRFPVALLTFALTQTTTRPVQRLAERLREAGFVAVEEERLSAGAFSIVSGVKEEVHRESA